MEEHKVIIVVVILGIAAIVMMGLVAKVALLETQVANSPVQHDTLRRPPAKNAKNRPPPPTEESAGEGGAAAAEAPKGLVSFAPSATGNATTGAAVSFAASRPDPAAEAAEAKQALATAEQSIARMMVVNHMEEVPAVATAVGENGLLLVSGPQVAGGYEASITLPGSKRKSNPFNRFVVVQPESQLALVRVDNPKEPLPVLRTARVQPVKNDRVTLFFDSGQLDLGRSEGTVEALLAAGDVEKKLQLPVPALGDAVWFEIRGIFPPQIHGAPLVNRRGELVGVALMDSTGTPAATATAGGNSLFGGGGAVNFGAAPTGAGMTNRRIYAVSHPALTSLLESAPVATGDLLFTLESAPLQMPAPKKPAPGAWSVKLPAGATLDAAAFTAAATGVGAGTLNYAEGKKCATLALSERKALDGLFTVFAADGVELVRDAFVQGRRQGPLAIRGADGQLRLAAQFQNEARHGYCAYFLNGAPWLIQEYADGALGSQHLVKQGAVFHTIAPGKSLPTVDAVLARYGDWSDWDAKLKALEASIERWAKETDRQQRAGNSGRSNADRLTAAQREALAALEDFRNLAP